MFAVSSKWFFGSLIGAAAMLYTPLAAASPEIRSLIDQGQYSQARIEAEALDTAQGYLLASETLCAQILLGEVGSLNKNAKRARDYAAKAMALNPDLREARVQYALADGFVTRTTGDFKAWRKKLPEKTYASVTALHAEFPSDPRTAALVGAWHLGVIRKTGEKNGAKWFGADLAQGRRLYDLARAQAPQDILIAANYAAALLVIDESYAAEALEMLTAAADFPARNALDAKIQARAEAMSAALSVSYDDGKNSAEDFLDGKPL